MSLHTFMEKYFEELVRVNEFHCEYLTKNNFTFPKCNYIDLKRFIDTATNFLSEIDVNLFRGLLAKLYNDSNSLYQYLKKMQKMSEYSEYVFSNYYLPEVDEYKQYKERYELLKTEIENYNKTIQNLELQLKKFKEPPKEPEQLNKYKKLKKQHVDSIYYISKIKYEFDDLKKKMSELEKNERKRFIPAFDKYKQIHLEKLKRIINIKLFYYEKLMWAKASESEPIRKFFEEANIEGDFSTKTFINYFLKNIDTAKSSNAEWLTYLKNLLKVIE